jgi:hypothetical protein
MQQLSSILAHRQPQGVLELGRDRDDASWSATPDLVGARIAESADRDMQGALDVVSAWEADGVPLDLVIDHPAGEPERARQAFELFFGRMAGSGLYVIDGSLPASLVLELMLAAVVSPDLVDRVELTSACIVVERGSRPATPDAIRVRDITTDPFGVIA